MSNIEYLRQVLDHARTEIISLIDEGSDHPPVVTEIELAMDYLSDLDKPQIELAT